MFAGSRRLEDAGGIATLAEIPFDVSVSSAVDRGTPIVLADRVRPARLPVREDWRAHALLAPEVIWNLDPRTRRLLAMLSLQFIREHPDVVRKALADRQTATAARSTRSSRSTSGGATLLAEVGALRAEQNAAGKKIGAAKDPAERQRMIDAMKGVSTRVDELTPQLREIEERLDALADGDPEHPRRRDAVRRERGRERRRRSSTARSTPTRWRKPHWELGEALGIIDFERGVKLSGSRFYVLKGAGARLQRALIAFMLDLHIDKHGYTRDLPAVRW